MTNDQIPGNGAQSDDPIYAVLGVLAQTGSANGRAPDEAELHDYLAGKIDEKRAEEIHSHLAHDPSLLERAISAAADQSSLELDEPSSPIVDASDRFAGPSRQRNVKKFGGLVAIAASVLIAVGLITLDSDGSRDRQNVRVVQTSQAPASATERDATIIRLGFVADGTTGGPSADTEVNAFLQSCVEDCARQGRLFEFGATLRALAAACRSGGGISDDSISALRSLASGPDAITSDPWRRYVADLLAAESNSETELCRIVSAMTAGF
jgi:hypothetical protein